MAPALDPTGAPAAGEQPAPSGPADPLGRAVHLALGSAAVVLGAIGRGLLRLGAEDPDPPARAGGSDPAPAGPPEAPRPASDMAGGAGAADGPPGAGDDSPAGVGGSAEGTGLRGGNMGLVTLAVVGVGAEVTRRAVRVATAAAEAAEHGATILMEHRPVPDAVERFRGGVASWGGRGQEALRSGESAAVDLGLNVVTTVVPTVASRLDIDAIVEQVDIGRIIDRIDLNEIVSRLDLNAIADRIDIERIVQRLDLAAIASSVLDQLDLTSITQSVIEQLDLTDIARRVMDELELGELIRESSSTVTVEAVDALRVGGMNADRFVAQLMNRILLRRNGEGHTPDGSEDAGAPPGDTGS